MALVKCHECKNEVSSDAPACPKCGAVPQKGEGASGILGLIIILLLVFGIAFFASDGTKASLTKSFKNEIFSLVYSIIMDSKDANSSPFVLTGIVLQEVPTDESIQLANYFLKIQGVYNVTINGSDRAILLSHKTKFSNQGLFTLMVKKIGTKEVVFSGVSGGFKQVVNVYEEADEIKSVKINSPPNIPPASTPQAQNVPSPVTVTPAQPKVAPPAGIDKINSDKKTVKATVMRFYEMWLNDKAMTKTESLKPYVTEQVYLLYKKAEDEDRIESDPFINAQDHTKSWSLDDPDVMGTKASIIFSFTEERRGEIPMATVNLEKQENGTWLISNVCDPNDPTSDLLTSLTKPSDSAPANLSPQQTAYIAGDNVTLRKTPKILKDNKVSLLKLNTKVSVKTQQKQEDGTIWVMLVTETGVTGWVRGDFVGNSPTTKKK